MGDLIDREAAMMAGYRVCAETRHVTLGTKAENEIRAARPTPASEGQE